jgi:hypothetical protein
MARPHPASILTHFAALPDPRRERRRLHRLLDLLAIAICAVIAGCDDWVEVAAYGRKKIDWLRTFLPLPNGIPSHDTFGRVFSRLDPHAFPRCFLRWVEAVQTATGGKLVAIDGKTLRHSFDTAAGKGALHLVSAWAGQNHLVLGQRAVDGKSNEITAVPELLALLDLTGAVVTLDAMGCQKEIVSAIRDRGADYVITVKGNQGTLYDDLSDYFVDGSSVVRCKPRRKCPGSPPPTPGLGRWCAAPRPSPGSGPGSADSTSCPLTSARRPASRSPEPCC